MLILRVVTLGFLSLFAISAHAQTCPVGTLSDMCPGGDVDVEEVAPAEGEVPLSSTSGWGCYSYKKYEKGTKRIPRNTTTKTGWFDCDNENEIYESTKEVLDLVGIDPKILCTSDTNCGDSEKCLPVGLYNAGSDGVGFAKENGTGREKGKCRYLVDDANKNDFSSHPGSWYAAKCSCLPGVK